MEDKNKNLADKKQLKKPTGKSATGKPLDGIEVNPQLDNGRRKTNEDFVALTASLHERKALTIAQRQKRAREFRKIEPKLKRAREVSRSKMAGESKLKARAEITARNILKKRFSARKNIPYAELTTSEKIQVDTAVAKKGNLIKKIAARLLPRIRKAEYERLKTFHHGKQMQSLHTSNTETSGVMPKFEDFNSLFVGLNSKSTLQLVDIVEESIKKYETEDLDLAINLRKMLNAVMPKDHVTEALLHKSERSNIPFSTLKEVYERGVSSYEDSNKQTEDQFAFNRVHSYIAKGKAWYLDADLREEKIMNEKLDGAFYDLIEKRGLWDNIHAKRERIKRGSGERMRKPGSKGAPTTQNFKAAQESVQIDEANKYSVHKGKEGWYVNQHTDNGVWHHSVQTGYHDSKEKAVSWAKKHAAGREHTIDIKEEAEIEESNNTPYVRPHIEKGSTKQSGWKASNKHGRVKYFGMDFKKSAEKHAGISETKEIVDRPPPSQKVKRRHQEIQKKIIDESLNETFNIAYAAGIGVTLSAEECGIKMKPAFELHPDVVDAMEEVRSADVEGIIVRTADGKTVVRKQKRNKKIIGSGNLTDGKPDDTV